MLVGQPASAILDGKLSGPVFAHQYAAFDVVGYIKGKSAIHLARVYGERKQNYAGQSFWARGYFVSTVGRDEATIREYIRD